MPIHCRESPTRAPPEKLAHRSRTLNPRTRPRTIAASGGFWVRNFQLHPHVFQDVVLRLEPATVAVDDQARGPFHEGLPSASTPVTTSGTACTMRVLRRLRSSVLVFVTLSETMSEELGQYRCQIVHGEIE